jgi:hypothetical protein
MTFASRLSVAAAPLKHAWEHTVGSSRALPSLCADWQMQLQRCHDELGFRHVRFHALLTDDMGTLISHQERPLYSFFNADRIWNFLLSIGMRPFVELGFMPEMLASGHETVFHFRGSVTPPLDHANPCRRWREMGEPKYLSRSQVEQLEAASRLVKKPLGFAYENRTVRFDVDLPPHAVAAVTLMLALELSDAGTAA